MALPNMRLCNLLFEMSTLIKHRKGTDPKLGWIKTEQELVRPFKPLDVLPLSSITNRHDYSSHVGAWVILNLYLKTQLTDIHQS